ncbi:hypothetical protein SUGI_0977500 [Cryptomeria japonica]|nr:hypothetical protein SUGI_0977500 [Cryptomeria japonica]
MVALYVAPNAGAAPPWRICPLLLVCVVKAQAIFKATSNELSRKSDWPSTTVLLRYVMHLSGRGRGYDVIDEMKKRLDAVCPETSLCLEQDIPWLWAICRVFNKGNGEPSATFSRKDSQSGRADPSIERHLNSRISTSVENEFVRTRCYQGYPGNPIGLHYCFVEGCDASVLSRETFHLRKIHIKYQIC